MTRDDIKAEFDRFIEFPEGSPRTMVTVTSTLFFAEHIARMATSAEREACAKQLAALGNDHCAAAIRARGQQ